MSAAENHRDFYGKGVYTFLSYYSIDIASKTNNVDYSRFTKIGIDGIAMTVLYRFLFNSRIKRFSFDYSSIAPHIFRRAQELSMSVSVIGSTEENLYLFKEQLTREYPSLKLGIWNCGFMSESRRTELIDIFSSSDEGIVLIGMGTKYQDNLALELYEVNNNLHVYTCGGFIHQSAHGLSYYPRIVNILNIRVLYRLFKEKGIIRKMLSIKDLFLYPIKIKLK